MLKRNLGIAVALGAGAMAYAAPVMSLDIVDPGDLIAQPPVGVLCLDVLLSVSTADGLWTAGGMSATAGNGATFRYRPQTDGSPDLDSPMLGGLAATRTMFATSFTDPRDRGPGDPTIELARFQEGEAGFAGGYSPPTPTLTANASTLNVAWFRAPDGSPPYSGAVARVAVNLPAGILASDVLLTDGSATPPAGRIAIVVSTPGSPAQSAGTVNASQNFPNTAGRDWNLSIVPEPASLVLLVLGGLAAFRRR